MLIAYQVEGKTLGMAPIDKSSYLGIDIRGWYDVTGNKIVITKKVDRRYEAFSLIQNDDGNIMKFDVTNKSMLEEL